MLSKALEGETKQKIVQLLADAFPSKEELDELTDYCLQRPLHAITTTDHGIQFIARIIVNWCLTQGENFLENLIICAIKQRPNNSDLIYAFLLCRYPAQIAQAMYDCYIGSVQENAQLGKLEQDNSKHELIILSLRNTEGYRCDFEKGSIYWSERGGAQIIRDPIRVLHHSINTQQPRGPIGDFGFPLSNMSDSTKSPFGTEGLFQRFEGKWDDYPKDVNINPVDGCGGTIYWSQRYGAHGTWGAIGILYERLSGTGGPLGFPTSDERDASPSEYGTTGRVQEFEGGIIHWCNHAGAVLTRGLIRDYHRDTDGSRGKLGFPISPEVTMPPEAALYMTPEDKYDLLQHFEGGDVIVRNGNPQDPKT